MSSVNAIPEGWEETTLGEVIQILDGDRGKNYPNGDDFSNSGYCLFLNTKNVPNRDFSFSETMFISIEKDNELGKGKLEREDFILTTRGTIGNFAFYSNDILYSNIRINSGMVILRFNTINKAFFKFYLGGNLFKNQVQSLQSGSAQPQLPIRDLKTFKIILPKISEQKAIANILTAFDDKIENLQDQNKTLEQTAQTIFAAWFGKYKVGDELPDGWRVGELGEKFDISIGRTPPRKETQWFSEKPTGKKWISIKDIGNCGVYIHNTSEYLTDKAIDKFNIPVIPKNTTVLSFKMTVGKLTITTEEMLSNEAIAHLKIKDNSNLSSEYIYLYLQNLDFNSLGSTSSIVTAINSTIIKNLSFIIPVEKTLKEFQLIIDSIFSKIKNNTQQIQSLKKTRDTLLPKLMSGQLRVKMSEL